MRLNFLSVELVLQTRGPKHVSDVVAHLESRTFQVRMVDAVRP